MTTIIIPIIKLIISMYIYRLMVIGRNNLVKIYWKDYYQEIDKSNIVGVYR